MQTSPLNTMLAHVRAQRGVFYIRTDSTPPSSRTTHLQMSYVKCSHPGDNEGCWVSWRDLAAPKLRTDSLRMLVFVRTGVCVCTHQLIGREIHQTVKLAACQAAFDRMFRSDPLRAGEVKMTDRCASGYGILFSKTNPACAPKSI